MKNGIGEDITEGKISFPIIYCASRIYGRRMSCYMINEKSTMESSFNDDFSDDEEKDNESLIDLVNKSNVYSLSQSIIEKKEKPNSKDLFALFEILQEKTSDKEKIEEAISILKSKSFI